MLARDDRMTRALFDPMPVRAAAIIAGCLVGPIALAQQAPPLEAVPEPPALPEKVQSGEVLEPDVRIVQGERKRVAEYRVNGQLRAVRVEPDNAPPYYLIDTDEDGKVDTRANVLGEELLLPHWVLFSW